MTKCSRSFCFAASMPNSTNCELVRACRVFSGPLLIRILARNRCGDIGVGMIEGNPGDAEVAARCPAPARRGRPLAQQLTELCAVQCRRRHTQRRRHSHREFALFIYFAVGTQQRRREAMRFITRRSAQAAVKSWRRAGSTQGDLANVKRGTERNNVYSSSEVRFVSRKTPVGFPLRSRTISML